MYIEREGHIVTYSCILSRRGVLRLPVQEPQGGLPPVRAEEPRHRICININIYIYIYIYA